MSEHVSKWIDEMTRPENEKEFCDWARSTGMMHRQLSEQDKRRGFEGKKPNPSFYGYNFKGRVLESYWFGWFSI